MHLAYADESHDKSEYWIASLIVPALRAQALEFAPDDIVAKAQMAFPVVASPGGKPVELHGHALAQGRDEWAPMEKMLRARLGVYEDALRAIASVEGGAIVRTGVDRKRLAQRYGDRADHPHEWALRFALKRTP